MSFKSEFIIMNFSFLIDLKSSLEDIVIKKFLVKIF